MTTSIATILNKSPHSKSFDKHCYIYQQGEEPDKIYYITEGLVGLYALSSSGKEILLRIFGPRQYFGHRSFLSQGPYHATAYTLKKTHLHYMHALDLQKILTTNPEATLDLARNLACELLRAENRLRDLTDLSQANLIVKDGRKIIIQDEDALFDFSESLSS